MKVKSLRAFNLHSLTGHTVSIPADVAVDIPDACAKEAFAQGCVAVDSGAPASALVPETDAEKVAKRAASIQKAIEELIAMNDKSNFKPDGTPKHQAVTKLVGIVSNDEIEQVWAVLTKKG